MLNEKNLALAGGILWSGSLFLFALLNLFFGYAPMWMALISDAYIGFEVTFLGIVIGALWGFVDAFVGLYILAWLYNKLNG